jgi:hypothetical protein
LRSEEKIGELNNPNFSMREERVRKIGNEERRGEGTIFLR